MKARQMLRCVGILKGGGRCESRTEHPLSLCSLHRPKALLVAIVAITLKDKAHLRRIARGKWVHEAELEW